jgi:hypothetical protein
MNVAYKILNVPLIPQQLNMACWYASAQTLIAWRRGSRRMTEMAHPDPSQDATLVSRYKANNGLAIPQVVDLAKRLGLREVPPQSPTLEAVESWLRFHGPIWFAGLFPSGHAVVITGIDDSGIAINDPWPPTIGARRTLTIPEFVKVLQPLGGAVLAPNFLHFPN